MLKVRLQRVGRKNDPSFRVIVTESRKDSQSGKFIEVLGHYNARHGKPAVKAERVRHWLSMGAQASGTVHNLLVDLKVIDKKKVNVMPKRKPTAAKAPADKPVEKTEEKAAPAEKVAEKVEIAPAEVVA